MYAVIHKKCEQVAFYFKERIHPGELIYAKNVILKNGECPPEHSSMICGSCGVNLSCTDIYIGEHWSDWFIINNIEPPTGELDKK